MKPINSKHHFHKVSKAYLRWKKQLIALHSGNFRRVRALAQDAKYELESKTDLKQMNLFSLR